MAYYLAKFTYDGYLWRAPLREVWLRSSRLDRYRLKIPHTLGIWVDDRYTLRILDANEAILMIIQMTIPPTLCASLLVYIAEMPPG